MNDRAVMTRIGGDGVISAVLGVFDAYLIVSGRGWYALVATVWYIAGAISFAMWADAQEDIDA